MYFKIPESVIVVTGSLRVSTPEGFIIRAISSNNSLLCT